MVLPATLNQRLSVIKALEWGGGRRGRRGQRQVTHGGMRPLELRSCWGDGHTHEDLRHGDTKC